ncbi:FAD-dependent monooxygenase [Actinacidiphila soli]|uniref:FAD-dependent monooxygenase n=1 Tax=Actinacidiphila soli TaxID=2487275 RepID=UPI000FCBC300|nr:FAD-dependent monooxygenase [Actinacidiphila soli]
MDPVIIAGAGPVGLALALGLARHGVPSIVLDENDGQVLPGAERTAVLGPVTAGLVARLGYPGVYGDATAWTAWRTVRRRQEAVRVEFGADSEAPLHISQARLERGLRAAAAAEDLVRIVPKARLVTLEQDGSGVTVHTRGTDATWWRGSYLVGCDGPRSTVRKLLGVRFPGRTAVDRYAVAALRVELPWPAEALLHRDPPGAGLGPEVTARPLPDGVWRLDWLLPAKGGPLTSDDLVARIRGTLAAWSGSGAVPPYELLGSAEHPVHQRLARRWRAGRVFLAGDAAHLVGALGAQGLEEGLRDAGNLAWKLSLAWHYGASDTLLDSYQAERRGAVGARLRATDQVLPLLRAEGVWHSLRRSVLSGLSGSGRRYAELLTDGHLGRGPLGAPPVYARSPLALPAPRGGSSAASPLVASCATPPGAAVVDVEVTALDGSRAWLYDRLGYNLLVVLIAPGTGVWESRHWLTAGLMPRLAKAVATLPTRAELLVAEAYPGSTAHSVLLIRPDGHLVTAMTGCRPAELYSYADLARGGPPLPDAGDGPADAGGAGEPADGPSEPSEPSERVSGRTRKPGTPVRP